MCYTLPEDFVDLWTRAALCYKQIHSFVFDESKYNIVKCLQGAIIQFVDSSRRRWLTHHCLMAVEHNDAVSEHEVHIICRHSMNMTFAFQASALLVFDHAQRTNAISEPFPKEAPADSEEGEDETTYLVKRRRWIKEHAEAIVAKARQ